MSKIIDQAKSAAVADFSRRAWMRGAGVFTLSAALFSPLVFANDLKLKQAAPPLVLHALDGQNIATEALHGKVVIVTFWASWCEPCLAELPDISAFAASHANDGVQVLGFSLDDAENLPQVRKMASQLSFPVGLLGSPWAGGYGRIWRCPVSFVIDRNGRLAYNGWDDDTPALTAERLQKIVAPLL